MWQNVEKKLVLNLLKREVSEKDYFYTREIPLSLRQIESSNREPEIRFFLSFQKEKKFRLVLSYLSATEI